MAMQNKHRGLLTQWKGTLRVNSMRSSDHKNRSQRSSFQEPARSSGPSSRSSMKKRPTKTSRATCKLATARVECRWHSRFSGVAVSWNPKAGLWLMGITMFCPSEILLVAESTTGARLAPLSHFLLELHLLSCPSSARRTTQMVKP